MTQRVRALLDEAVSNLEPRNPDPVAAVIARGRAARHRALGAGMLAAAVLIGGGLAVGAQVGGGVAPSEAGEAGRPPTPGRVGDTVVAGGMVLPVPKGWRVVTHSFAKPCGMLANTILVAGPDESGCQMAPIEVRGTRRVVRGNLVPLPPKIPDAFITAPRTYTLRGGEPAWLTDGVDDPRNGTRKAPGYSYHNNLLLPWSRVVVTLRAPGPEQLRIIDSIRTAPPRGTTRLTVPGTVVEASLTMFDAAGRKVPAGYGASTDRPTIAAVLGLLRGRTSVVDNAHACAGPGQRTARLNLNATVRVAPSAPGKALPPEALSPEALGTPTVIMISIGGGCQEAVSSGGGRVRLSDATVSELARLFGIARR